MEELRSKLFEALRRASQHFGLQTQETKQLFYLKDPAQNSAKLRPEICEEWVDKGKITAMAIQMALRADLDAALDQARKVDPPVLMTNSRRITDKFFRQENIFCREVGIR